MGEREFLVEATPAERDGADQWLSSGTSQSPRVFVCFCRFAATLGITTFAGSGFIGGTFFRLTP